MEIKWLPVMGIGGYIDLYKKLVPEYKEQLFTGAISMKIAKRMEIELPKYTELSSRKNGFIVGGYNQICNICKSRDIIILNEKVFVTDDIEWIKISAELL